MTTLIRKQSKTATRAIGLLMVLLVTAACGNMREQPKFSKPYDSSPTFGTAARLLEEEAVPIGFLNDNEHFAYGTVEGEYATTYPFEITEEILEEGRRWYEGFCSPCHGFSGYGDGVTSAEGYPQPGPASYHIDRLRDAPNGYFFEVITEGQGIMYSYGARIPVEERWAIIAYIRALQFSQNAPVDALPADLQAELGS